jgi:hypothetical protein
MGKRSDFERVERDFYPTPYEAVIPLLSHLEKGLEFDEPCCGNGDLINHLESAGYRCRGASDIKSSYPKAEIANAITLISCSADYFITNPPWDRKILHPIIKNLSEIAPTWLLFDADWMHTKQSSELIKYCHKIVSVGRVKWIPDSKMTGKDNCCWYLFKSNVAEVTEFHGRVSDSYIIYGYDKPKATVEDIEF